MRILPASVPIFALLAACASETSPTPSGTNSDTKPETSADPIPKRPYNGEVCPGAVAPAASERTCRLSEDCAARGGGDCIAHPEPPIDGGTTASCAADADCPMNTRCLTLKFGERDCVAFSCQVDTDCECGACVGLLCHARAGGCSDPG